MLEMRFTSASHGLVVKIGNNLHESEIMPVEIQLLCLRDPTNNLVRSHICIKYAI